MNTSIFVNSEIAALERLIIHSPDSGLGKVVPSKAQDWLFEDIIHLDTMRKKEYDLYVKLLLHFLDPEAIRWYDSAGDARREFFKPNSDHYFESDKVIDIERLLFEVLENPEVRIPLVAAVAAIEECSYLEMRHFLKYSNRELSKILITGMTDADEMFFPPVPNLIFTRDLGVVVNDHIILTKPAKSARTRESLIAKYIFFNHPLFSDFTGRIIEIEEDEAHFLLPEDKTRRIDTLEGGDVMMVAPNHLLIGISERTTLDAARQTMSKLFEKKVVEKVSIVKIPSKRDYMHIDTVFTHIRRDVWVLLRSIVHKKQDYPKAWDDFEPAGNDEKVRIKTFVNGPDGIEVRDIDHLEDLLARISKDDLKCEGPVRFVYSGNDRFPFGEREQWTDSCNLLVLREGVAIAYDRNDKTDEAFREQGFRLVSAAELLADFENNRIRPEEVKDTIILLPSAELSRARGGSHCMSLPLKRKDIFEKIN
ncbi:arginine deiminase family protein [Leadbetterella sp. DM7]|uniref:arginine deiminase family protein n=1 Tax=Leadbetterella sp. DM7 TaxID=3235085 RepID=UPI00349EAF28